MKRMWTVYDGMKCIACTTSKRRAMEVFIDKLESMGAFKHDAGLLATVYDDLKKNDCVRLGYVVISGYQWV